MLLLPLLLLSINAAVDVAAPAVAVNVVLAVAVAVAVMFIVSVLFIVAIQKIKHWSSQSAHEHGTGL